MNVSDSLSDPRVGTVVSTITTGTGVGTVLNWIPSDIGKLASVVGIALSLVLIWLYFKKGLTEIEDRKKIKLEIELLKAKLDDERAKG